MVIDDLDDLYVLINELQDAFDVRFWGAAVAAKAANIRKGGSVTLTVGEFPALFPVCIVTHALR